MDHFYCPYCMKPQHIRQERQIHGLIVTIECYCTKCLHTWWTNEQGRTIGGPIHSQQLHPYKYWRTY